MLFKKFERKKAVRLRLRYVADSVAFSCGSLGIVCTTQYRNEGHFAVVVAWLCVRSAKHTAF